jgi:hypothetical protein
MIRPITFVTTMIALSSGAWMFVVKHQAEQLDRQIGGVTSQIRSSEQRIRVLRAEWALETDPTRLARLATLFMPTLKPMLPNQMVSWSAMADRLPPPGATLPHLPLPPPLPGDLPDTAGAGGPIALIATPGPADVDLPPNAVPVSSAQPQAHLAAAHSVAPSHPSPVIRHVALPVAHHALPRHAQAVWSRPSPAYAGSKHPAWSHPVPLGQSVLAPVRTVHPMGARVMTINAQAMPVPHVTARAAAPAASRGSTSVFGGYAADLAPPRPVGSSAP